MPAKPSFMIHTGDITHLRRHPSSTTRTHHLAAKLDVHYVPASMISSMKGSSSYREPTAAHQGRRLVFVRRQRRPLHRSRQRGRPQAGGSASRRRAARMAGEDLKGRSKSTPIVVFAHIPLWTVYPEWLGTETAPRAGLPQGFGSVTVLNGHIHQVMQKVEGNVTFHTARSTAFRSRRRAPLPPGSDEGRRRQAARLLGVAASTSSAANNGSRSSTRRCKAKEIHDVISHFAQSCDSPRRRYRPVHLPASGSARAADTMVTIDNFTFEPAQLTVKVGTTSPGKTATTFRTRWCPRENSGRRRWIRRQLFVHVHGGGRLQLFLFAAPHMTGTIKVE